MNLTRLTALSPIDGRYRDKVESLQHYFSEYALICYRIRVELAYFLALCELPLPNLASFPQKQREKLQEWAETLTLADAEKVKSIEKTTNHDVKAVEYFIKSKFDSLGLGEYKEFVHFGLTSQDINNTAMPMLWRDALQNAYFPLLQELLDKLKELSKEWDNVPMLARTHGQPASPTRLGKEIYVFVYRIEQQLEQLQSLQHLAKFGGATGNFNAHHVAYPQIDWEQFADDFLSKKLGLIRIPFTTQIAPYDQEAAFFDVLKRMNSILLDMNRDFWLYISMDYFKQRIVTGEVGSSAMPHKVNPIDFENSEGNIGVANALFEHFSAKLPISRLQRDLSDSTVLRNIGVPFAHTLIALQSSIKGLNKVVIHQEAIEEDLIKNWVVVAEAIQTILRREGYPNPYEALKELTRTTEKVTKESMMQFIDGLKISEEGKQELKQITPFSYTGVKKEFL